MSTLYAFGVALCLSLVLTPLFRTVARKTGALYRPNKRSVNRVPIPLLGGVAIYLAASMAMFFFSEDVTVTKSLIVGGFVILVVGLIDDIFDLRPWQKVLGQVLSALTVVGLGVSISFIKDPFTGSIRLLGFLALPLTILWVVSFENVINLSDGLDGLAAGIVGIAALTIVFAAEKAGMPGICPEAAAVAGAVFGFLPYNFHPASIFMGDAGAMYLGLALAVLSVQGLVKSTVVMSVFAPILTLLVPISDAAFAILRRSFSGLPVATADHDHLHHRLLEMGMGQRKAVTIIYLVSLVFGFLGLVSGFVPVSRGGPLAGLAILGVFIVAYKVGLLNIRR
jgi:UDP-GlcNAc:undecaprenyl-phosphate GlcNAc-1-phosphate transferase